jgi:hypothetical protein
MDALDANKGFVGEAGLFYRQLAKRLNVDTRSLVGAVNSLWRAGKVQKLRAGTNYFYIVGISLPGYTFDDDEIEDLGPVTIE